MGNTGGTPLAKSGPQDFLSLGTALNAGSTTSWLAPLRATWCYTTRSLLFSTAGSHSSDSEMVFQFLVTALPWDTSKAASMSRLLTNVRAGSAGLRRIPIDALLKNIKAWNRSVITPPIIKSHHLPCTFYELANAILGNWHVLPLVWWKIIKFLIYHW